VASPAPNQPVALNRKARFDYFILDKFEAGIVLTGAEVKSIREGKINLKDSFVRILRGEAFLFNCHISLYSRIQGHVELEPARTRKLLLKRDQLEKLEALVGQKGHAIIPLSVYFKQGLIKLEIATARGKKQADKRETIKRRISDRESQAAIKQHGSKGR
jgi:SsrA-binding protein